jgi:F0F1-type ATP synthase delta subunit
MTSISRRQVARYAADQIAGGAKNRKVAQYLAAYLSETKATRQTDLLIADIEKFLDQDHGHSSVHVSSVHELTAELKKQIIKKLGITNSGVEINETTDSELLGGVIVSSAGKQYDGSLKTSIKQLKALGN